MDDKTSSDMNVQRVQLAALMGLAKRTKNAAALCICVWALCLITGRCSDAHVRVLNLGKATNSFQFLQLFFRISLAESATKLVLSVQKKLFSDSNGTQQICSRSLAWRPSRAISSSNKHTREQSFSLGARCASEPDIFRPNHAYSTRLGRDDAMNPYNA